MTDRAVKMRSANTTHTPRAGQRAGNGQAHKEHRHQGSARTWTPSRACNGTPTELESLAAMFDRLAKAAAAHDGDAAAGTFGESW
jgi:hypothetical protein